MSQTVNLVKEYYGKSLTGSKDLLTDACCTTDAMPQHARAILKKIHPEVSSRYYGCGLVLPELIQGCRVLDLGSGAGQDCYILSALVGSTGYVVGVDMTLEQLAVANQYIDFHTQAFGHQKPNVEFHLGYLEKLDQLPLAANSFDVIVSNCVINLCEDKAAVLSNAFNLLKPGGELYFSDVYSDRRIPDELRKDPVLYGECLAGAMYTRDFLALAKSCGFADVRQVVSRPLGINNAAVKNKVEPINFDSTTYRLFKVEGLEETCEDYGQAISYNGTVANQEKEFVLDQGHRFLPGRVTSVSRNTYLTLKESRFGEHFEFFGTGSTHFGGFQSSPKIGVQEKNLQDIGGGGCC